MKQDTPNPSPRNSGKPKAGRFNDDLQYEIDHMVELVREDEGDAAAEDRRRFERRAARSYAIFRWTWLAMRVVDVLSRLIP